MNQAIHLTRRALAAIALAGVADLTCAQVAKLAPQGSATYVTNYGTQCWGRST